MRIIAGENRGIVLAEVGAGDRVAHLRPTSDRVREALFSMLMSGKFGNPVHGSHVLDLFAGTGALGFEALSRGAAKCTFVDTGAVARRLIADNARRLNRSDQVAVLAISADALPAAPQACGLVFLDPPYGQNFGGGALQAAMAHGWIAPNAVIVWEDNTPQPAPRGCLLREHRRFGDTWISILEAAS